MISNGTIDQIAWDSHSDGIITVIFYVNNTFNQLIYRAISIIKDTTSPVISIIAPTTNDEFKVAPAYEIDVSDDHLDKMWYSFDEGVTKVPISSFIGMLDETIWNDLPNGYVTIRFYANDTMGNMNYDEVIVMKSTPAHSTPTNAIPGYDILILLGVITIISASIIRIKKLRNRIL